MEKTIGSVIASLRKEYGLTQLELAEKLGVTDKAVSKWERDLSCPDVYTLKKISIIFNVTIDDLMCFESAKKNIKHSNSSVIHNHDNVWIFLLLSVLFALVFFIVLFIAFNYELILVIASYPFLFVSLFMLILYFKKRKK